ncbi:hypothetical protein HDU98_008656 [Podochytrium sp. JEL0797]|nr:hypothetical protein HDU98_008656 [Podochytrium sp. JEL0797]
MLSKRELIHWSKAVLGFALTYAFVFTPMSSFLNHRHIYMCMYVSIIHTPNKTVGSFLNLTGLILLMVAAASVMWCILQGLCGTSKVAMAIGLFIWVYLVSLLRARSHERYYSVCMVGILIAYAATAKEVGALGPSLSGGSQLDYVYLRGTVESYCVGLLICLLVNVLIFPDFAETHLINNLDTVYSKMSLLTSTSITCIMNPDFSTEAYTSNCTKRAHLVSEIQKTFGLIDDAIAQASLEVTYSHFSMKDYTRIATSAKSAAAVLFSMNAVLSSRETLRLLQSPDFQQKLGARRREEWMEFDAACTAIFEGLVQDLRRSTRLEKEGGDRLMVELERTAGDAFRVFGGYQPDVFSSIFEDAKVTAGTLEGWELFVHLNFFSLGIKEFVLELASLHEESESRSGQDHPVRFHLNWFIPLRDLFRRIRARCVKGFNKPLPNWHNDLLVKVKDHFLSDSSVYACKAATAILCFQMVMFFNHDLYVSWFFERGIAPIVVTLSPSLGQTYGALFPRIMGTGVGASLGYASVLLFGKYSAWHILTSFVAAVPCMYIALFRKEHVALSRLTLISLTNYLYISVVWMDNPAFPALEVYLFRLVAVISVALCFGVLFTSVIYPQFARRRLRSEMSTIFKNLNVFYRKIVSNSLRTHNDNGLAFSETKSLRNKIFSQLVALEPLMKFSVLEPRIEGKFQIEEYREVVSLQYHLLDRLECLRLCVGDTPLDAKINNVLRFGEYGATRNEMHQSIRIVLFMYRSAFLTKLHIMPNLPNASEARERMIHGFVTMLVQHSQQHELDGSDPLDGVMPMDKKGMLDTLVTDKWVRVLGMSVSLREVSRVLDEMGTHMKTIFGESPDIVDPEKEELTPIIISTE